eukprot:jgi/Mesvir1/8826/Mv02727-RA.1
MVRGKRQPAAPDEAQAAGVSAKKKAKGSAKKASLNDSPDLDAIPEVPLPSPGRAEDTTPAEPKLQARTAGNTKSDELATLKSLAAEQLRHLEAEVKEVNQAAIGRIEKKAVKLRKKYAEDVAKVKTDAEEVQKAFSAFESTYQGQLKSVKAKLSAAMKKRATQLDLLIQQVSKNVDEMSTGLAKHVPA